MTAPPPKTQQQLRPYIKPMLRIGLSVYWLALFIATHLPSDKLPEIGTSDKLQHLAAFGILAFLTSHSIRVELMWRNLPKIGLATLCIVSIYAVLDENTQRFIPGRTYDELDMLADVGGGVLGFLAFLLLPKPRLEP